MVNSQVLAHMGGGCAQWLMWRPVSETFVKRLAHGAGVSLWPLTLVALSYPVDADWPSWRWGTGISQSTSLKKEAAQCGQLLNQLALTNLLSSPFIMPFTCVITEWKCPNFANSFGLIIRMKVGFHSQNVFLHFLHTLTFVVLFKVYLMIYDRTSCAPGKMLCCSLGEKIGVLGFICKFQVFQDKNGFISLFL